MFPTRAGRLQTCSCRIDFFKSLLIKSVPVAALFRQWLLVGVVSFSLPLLIKWINVLDGSVGRRIGNCECYVTIGEK